MPTASTASTVERKKVAVLQSSKESEQYDFHHSGKNLLKIRPALPLSERRNLYLRSHSTLNAVDVSKAQEAFTSENVTIQTNSDGSIIVSRSQDEKEKYPDRVSLDRRGLNSIPIISGEPKLRLLSLQHNLIIDLEILKKQKFPTLVFLDLYNNQLENMYLLNCLENLRVLLMGKNRIKKIEGLGNLKNMEVLDLHGNQIGQISGLSGLCELKVLNLAGNQIRSVGVNDLLGLDSLEELNLRRNRLKKLLGFGGTPNLYKLFISNNDIQSIEDISSIARSSNIKEITIDSNPVFLGGECVSFLVSYLPHLMKLNMMQVTEQVRKAAMAWRRNKETTDSSFMNLSNETSLNCRREEVISNARANWELLRSQTKCLYLTNNVSSIEKSIKIVKPDSDIILTSFRQTNMKTIKIKKKAAPPFPNDRVPLLPDKRSLMKTPSQDTENSQNTSSNNSENEFFKLPPILIPVVNKIDQKMDEPKEGSLKSSAGSISSIDPNVDSPISSLASASDEDYSLSESYNSTFHTELDSDVESDITKEDELENNTQKYPENESAPIETEFTINGTDNSNSMSSTRSSSTVALTTSDSSNLSKTNSKCLKSAINGKPLSAKSSRATTAKIKKQSPPVLPKDREQGGDYLIEISGRYLNVYGHGALRFIDKPWNSSKANDVTIVRFSYINFNNITPILNKLKHRFPNVDHFIFKETNIYCMGQLNALAEVQGLMSIYIDPEGNPILEKNNWKKYVIYRLAHWGLKILNNKEITGSEIKIADEEYQSLSDLVLWSLPDVLLQPLLIRLRIDVNQNTIEQNAKKWLLSVDPELKSVVCKEALQWKKGSFSQEEIVLRQKAKYYIYGLLENMVNAIDKLKILDKEWPIIMHEFVQNALLDYSQLDMYMKLKIHELNK